MNNDDEGEQHPIDRSLGLQSVVPLGTTQAVSSLVRQAADDSAKEDFKFARANIREVITNAGDAIAALSQLADSSQNPRAYEVLAKLMDTVVNANKQLLDTQKQLRDLAEPEKASNGDQPQNVTNNLFVGSTADLARVIQNLNNK